MNFEKMNDLAILIPAAGQSIRMGMGPKALLPIGGRSLLEWITSKSLQLASEVIVAAPPGQETLWAKHCPACVVIAGGESHMASVTALVQAAKAPLFMIMSVALPFTSLYLMHRVALAARQHGIASGYLQADMPLVKFKDGMITGVMSRHDSAIMQGPTAYERDLLLSLVARADSDDLLGQSWLEVAMRYGHAVAAVQGDADNIKLTTPADWDRAQHPRYRALLSG